MRSLTAVITALVLALSANAYAQEEEEGGEEAEEQPAPKAKATKAAKGKKGKDKGGLPLAFRFGASLDGDSVIDLNKTGTSVGNGAVFGANAGVSYIGIPKLSLDVDTELSMTLVPSFAVTRLELTPGARYQIIQSLYVRAGAPMVFYPSPFNLGVLAGVGYRQSLGSHVGAYAEVAYEHFFLKEDSRIVVRGGIDTHF